MLVRFTFIFLMMSQLLQAQSVVINELMSSNKTAVADEAGDFDDWIELYNNGDNSIDLSGYGLSDDAANLGKFKIPDGVSITGKGYLIIWADDDQEQGILHAQFKLSSIGETVFLTDPSNNVVDQIAFGEIPEDQTFARDPNGTGDFRIKNHSFGVNNDTATSSIEVMPRDVKVYPNPTIDVLNVDFPAGNKNYELTIMDIEGRVVIKNSDNFGKSSINLSSLPTGTYFLQINQYQSIKIQKLDKR